jgi:hypothetical protein
MHLEGAAAKGGVARDPARAAADDAHGDVDLIPKA